MTTNCYIHRGWGPVEAGTARLVRLVLDDAWNAESAACQLVDRVPNADVLRAIAANVRRADEERPTWVTARATQTMQHAGDGTIDLTGSNDTIVAAAVV